MTPAEMEAAIKEINEEMESLFGSPVSSDSGSVSTSPFDPPLASTIPKKAAAAQPQPSTLPRDDGHIDTRAVLLNKITTCTSELGTTADVERSTSLAKCIAECARAVAALVRNAARHAPFGGIGAPPPHPDEESLVRLRGAD